MDINHLYYLVDVAETKSITLSARRLFLSQQGLSQIILRLENELKVSLLNRHRKGVTLTEDGEIVVEKAKEILQKYEELLLLVQPFSRIDPKTLPRHLSIGVVPFISINLLPGVLNLFYKQFPAVEVHIHEKQLEDILGGLNKGELDIGLAIMGDFQYNNQTLSNHYLLKVFYAEELFAVAAKDSPVTKRKMLTKKDLYQYPMVLYNHETYLQIINQMFPDFNQLNILGKINSTDLYKNALINRQAIGITTSMDVKLLDDASLVTVPIKDSVSLHYVYVTRCPMPPIAEVFISVLQYYVNHKLNGNKVKETD